MRVAKKIKNKILKVTYHNQLLFKSYFLFDFFIEKKNRKNPDNKVIKPRTENNLKSRLLKLSLPA